MEAYKEQRSEEWLNFRKDKIGGSDAPIVLGLSPWKTALQLWEEKKGIRGSNYVSEAMKRGIEQESLALKYVQDSVGISFVPDVRIYKNNPKIIASFDGINEEQKIICECKCSKRYYKMASEGNVYPDTYCQVQHQLLVADLQDALLCCFESLLLSRPWRPPRQSCTHTLFRYQCLQQV